MDAIVHSPKTFWKGNIWPLPIVMTIREAININPKVGLALYSSQIDPNLPIYHDFSPNSRGHATSLQRGQISIFPVTTCHNHQVDFCNLLQHRKHGCWRCCNKLQNLIRRSWRIDTTNLLIWPLQEPRAYPPAVWAEIVVYREVGVDLKAIKG